MSTRAPGETHTLRLERPVSGPVMVPPTSRPVPELLEVIKRHEGLQGARDRWIPSRLIVVNYWVFGYQECHFVDGHLVLHGGNGTGKTTVLTAALPLALFGTKLAGTLDTMSGKARTLEYFLLGDKEDERDKLYLEDQRVAYIVWEFRHARTGEYRSIGQCLHARRKAGPGVKIEASGFCIKDGRRVGIDLALFHERSNRREPVPPEALEQVLIPDDAIRAAGTCIVDTVDDYTRLVAREIFGTDRVDELRGMVRTLLAIRRPVLNSGITPEQVCEMLSDSLPELDPDIIDDLDRALEGLDRITREAAEANEQRDAVGRLSERHTALVIARAARTAMQFLFEQALVDREDGTIEAAKNDLARLALERVDADAAMKMAEAHKASAMTAKDALKGDPVFALAQRVEAANNDLCQAQEAAQASLGRRQRATGAVEESSRAIVRGQEGWREVADEVRMVADSLRVGADEARWPVARLLAERLGAHVASIDSAAVALVPVADQPSTLDTAGRLRKDRIGAVLHAEGELGKREQQLRDAEARLGPIVAAHRAAEEALQESIRRQEEHRQTAELTLVGWHAKHAVIGLSREAIDRAVAAIREYHDPAARVSTVLEAITNELRTHATAAEQASGDELVRLRACRQELRMRQEDRDRVAGEPDHVPPPRPGQSAVRAALADAGIVAEPLYATVNVANGVSETEAARIEAVLAESGLLDALVVDPKSAAAAANCINALTLHEGGDRWLLPTASLTATSHERIESPAKSLSAYLTPASGQLKDEIVRSALDSVRVTSLDDPKAEAPELAPPAVVLVNPATGMWRHGLIGGHQRTAATGPEFVGLANRQAARARCLAALDAEIEQLHDRETQIAAVMQSWEDRRSTIRDAQRALTELDALEDLRATTQRRRDREIELQRHAEDKRRASAEVAQLMTTRDAAKEERDRRREAVPELAAAPVEQLSFVRDATARWLDTAKQWPVKWNAVLRAAAGLHDALERHARDVEGARETEEEHRRLDAAASARELTYRTLAVELEGAGHTDVVERIKTYDAQISEAEDAITKLIAALATNENKADERGKQREEAEKRRIEPAQAADELKKQLEEQLERHVALADAARHLRPGGGGLHAVARAIDVRPRPSRQDLANAQQVLEETSNAWWKEWSALRPLLDDLYAPEALQDDRVRVLINDSYQYGLEALANHLNTRVNTLQLAFHEKEAELYRSVFLDRMADGIREALRDADAMVKAINAILRDTKLKDGEQLSLRWTLKRDANDPLDAQLPRLVETLAKRSLKASPDDTIEWVHRYFSNRITELKAKRDSGTLAEKSLRAGLAKAFDYRNWHQFSLYAQQLGGTEQEIDAKRFGKRSGGQKVAATLVPLLSAIRVRSRAFAEDAPRIIALDEAFAGVDSDNTDALFAVLEQFEMSWIMTSEKLFGVSQELEGAMTHVLRKRVRANGPSIVASEYIVWDGTYRHDATTVRRRPTI
jgi:hypothetical protein